MMRCSKDVVTVDVVGHGQHSVHAKHIDLFDVMSHEELARRLCDYHEGCEEEHQHVAYWREFPRVTLVVMLASLEFPL